MEQPIDERRELYEKFKSELAGSPREIFYDEKDLVEIFDQASDMDDDYVRMEVLLHGFRLYPDSEDLKVRRAYFYSACGIDEGADEMNRGAHADGIMWDILGLRLADPSREEVEAKLDIFVDRTEAFDDEAIIQTVDCASALRAYDWLKRNRHKLQSKCSYLPTLFYELHVVASLNGDHQFAIQMLEELTDIEPFNGEYWCMLAEEHLKVDQSDEAVSAADYALAINADDLRAMAVKARALINADRDHDTSVDLLERVVRELPDEGFLVQSLAVAYTNAGRQKDAERLLVDYSEKFPTDAATIDYLLLLRYADISHLLDRYYQKMSETEEVSHWHEWARRHIAEGRYPEAAVILESYYRNAGLGEDLSLYFETLYQAKFYAAVVALYEYNAQDELPHAITPEMGVSVVLSYMHLGREQDALKTARSLIASLRGGGASITRTLTTLGFVALLSTVINALESGEHVDVDAIDPFDKAGGDQSL